MALRYQRMRMLAYISPFPRLFPARSSLFTAEVYSYYYTVNDSSPIPINHGPAATLAYVNRKLINTLVYLLSPRGPYGREEEHAMRYYSGGLGQRLLAIPSALGWTWLLGYNASIIARRPQVSYLASEIQPPPLRSARHCDPLRLRIFAPRNVRSLQP